MGEIKDFACNVQACLNKVEPPLDARLRGVQQPITSPEAQSEIWTFLQCHQPFTSTPPACWHSATLQKYGGGGREQFYQELTKHFGTRTKSGCGCWGENQFNPWLQFFLQRGSSPACKPTGAKLLIQVVRHSS